MSQNAHRDLYERLLESNAAMVKVSPKKVNYSPGYIPSISEFEAGMDLKTPISVSKTGSRQIDPSTIQDIIEDANVVSGIEDIFAVNAKSNFSPTELEFIKASPKQIAKLRQLAKKLPDESKNTLEQLLKELDEQ